MAEEDQPQGTEDEDLKKTFGLGGGDDDEKTIETEFGADQFYWQDLLLDRLTKEIRAAEKETGIMSLEAYLVTHQQAMLEYLTNDLLPLLTRVGMGGEGGGINVMGRGDFLTNNPKAIDLLLSAARTYLTKQDPSGLMWQVFNLQDKPQTSGLGGPKRPTPEQIRQNFDLDQLSRAYTDLYRGMLLDEPRDSRAVAKAYVETIVANPDQKVDYETFMRGHIKKEPRYAAIYANKPRGMSEAQFLQPYVASAVQVLRPKDVASAATGGARFGASPDAFREMLQKSNAYTTSTPFITSFEERMQALKGVFRG